MLREIRITDLGVIAEATLELSPGLTVVTGETGAGKTMVVHGLGLLSGARADSALVRSGADRAVIEGVLDLPAGHRALERAAEAGADLGEDVSEDLVLIRGVGADGRSRAHVGGRRAPVSLLGELAESLIAVHGQADQWRLRRVEEHRELLDGFGGERLGSALTDYRVAFEAHRQLSARLADLEAAAAERAREAEMLRLGLERVGAVDPQPGEDVALRVEDDRSSHAEELRQAAAQARAALAGDDDGYGVEPAPDVLALLTQARSALTAGGELDPELQALGARVVELSHLTSDLASDLTTYLSGVDVDPARLAWVQDRRAQLTALTRLYGENIDEVLTWAREAADRLLDLESTTDTIEALRDELAAADTARKAQAAQLTALREQAASDLGTQITRELASLAMPGSRVHVAVEPLDRLTPAGADLVEIRLASGSGAPWRPVAKAASGGELSRVMLAIEVVTAARTPDRLTFIFDEVDAGVGGRAALAVGGRLAELARHTQVVVVTHLAQVAAFADRHLVVTKTDDGAVVASGVQAVDGSARVSELARMLGGSDTTSARRHADELLAHARDGSAG